IVAPDRLIVRLFNVTAGSVVLPEPLKTRLLVAPPVSVPLDVEMAPLSVSVFAPIENAPLDRVSVPLIVGLLFRVTPLVLLMVRLVNAVTMLGIPTPAELPPKERLDDDVVARLEAVPAMAGPFRASVFVPTVSVPLVRVRV